MEGYLTAYIPIVIMLALAVGIGIFIIAASHILSPRYRSKAKEIPYESGMKPVGDAREKFHIRFAIVAILFLIFDVEAVFIFPWAIFYRQSLVNYSTVLILGEMFIFIAVLLFGLAYAWARGGLDWER